MNTATRQHKLSSLSTRLIISLILGMFATPVFGQNSPGIIGQIIDKETGQNLSGVTIIAHVLESPDAGKVGEYFNGSTDIDGRFRMPQVPVGAVELSIFKGGYRLTEIERLVIKEGNQPTVVNYALPQAESVVSDVDPGSLEDAPDIFELAAFTVTAEEMDDEQALFIDLRRSVGGTVDFLTSDDFRKFAVSDLSGAVQKMPGVNVVEGKFAVVRGMNDRFNSTLINGLPVPSPDPLRQGVQLDLFPTSIIDNVVAHKSFLPQMPGNTSGAGFELQTRKFPGQNESYIKFGFRINTNAGDYFLRDPERSSKDAWASGKGTRGPFAKNLEGGGSAVQENFLGVEGSAPVSLTFGAGTGNTVEFRERKLGYVIAISYDSHAQTEGPGVFQNWFGLDSRGIAPGFPNHNPASYVAGSLYTGELAASGFIRYVRSVYSVLIGGLAQVSYDLDKKGFNRLSLVFLGSQTADDSVRRFSEGYLPEGGIPDSGVYSQNKAVIGVPSGNQEGYYYNEQIDYEERNLTVWQLKGEHLLPNLGELQADWGVSYAKTSSDLPRQIQSNYLRYSQDVVESVDPGFGVDGGNDGVGAFLQEISRSIDHEQISGRFDLAYPFQFLQRAGGRASAGVFYDSSERDVIGSSLVLDATGDATNIRASSPEALSQALVELDQTSRTGVLFPTNAFVSQDINAGYLSLKLPLPFALSIEGGVRFETIEMEASGSSSLGGDSIGPSGASLGQLLESFRIARDGSILRNSEILGFDNPDDPSGRIDENLLLPGLSLVYQPTTALKFILGFSETIARPSFRELSPYFDREAQTGDIVLGNPNLELAEIQSFDFRIEYVFDDGDLASISAFSKTVENPIEQALLRSQPSIEFRSFFNNPSQAAIEGIEVELRRNLDFISDKLGNFSIGFNAAYIEAEVGVPDFFPLSYFAFRVNQNTGEILRVTGPFVGDDGPPLGVTEDQLQTTRRLFDQPEWLANADITYSNDELGLNITLSVYAQSSVLSGVGVGSPGGSQNVLDQYTDSYEDLRLSMSKRFTLRGRELSLSFAVSNITDSKRSIYYDKDIAFADTYERLFYKIGQTYRISLQHEF